MDALEFRELNERETDGGNIHVVWEWCKETGYHRIRMDDRRKGRGFVAAMKDADEAKYAFSHPYVYADRSGILI